MKEGRGNMATSQSNGTGSEGAGQAAGDARPQDAAAITPELVREVAEKVYALMVMDLKLGRERRGVAATTTRLRRGG